MAFFLATSNSSNKWLVDSGCTNHMTFDHDLFKELDTLVASKVKIGNGEYIVVNGKGTKAIESTSGTKLIRDVLFNVLKTRPVTEPEKLSVHGSLVGLVVEPWLNR